MHHPMLPHNSPQRSHHRSLTIKSLQQPIYHMTVKQLSSIEQYYDDVKYQTKIVDKFIIIAQIKQVTKALSQRNVPILKIKLTDGTNQWRQSKQFVVYDVKSEDKLIYAMNNHLYVQIACQAKVTGLVYKTEIQFNAVSLKLVNDFNKITEHLLSCIKTNLVTV